MASSESEIQQEISSFFERFFRQRDMSLFLPFILGFTNNENPTNPDQESTNSNSNSTRGGGGGGDRIILINPFTQGMMVIEGTSNVDSLLRNLASKDGQPPASKASIEAMKSIKIGGGEEEGVGGECVICLEEYKVDEMVKEMPCKHKFHGNCIDKWLNVHGSCPVCRYKMPVDEEETGNKAAAADGDDDQQQQQQQQPERREIWITFSVNGGSRRTTDGDDSVDAASPNPRSDREAEN